MISLSTPLSSIRGIGGQFITRLRKLNIETVGDLLRHFPSRYEDFTQIYAIADLEPGQQATIHGSVEEIEVRRSWRKRMIVVEAVIADETGSIRAVWFNQPYVQNVLKPGRIANFSGKVTLSEGELQLAHPTYEIVGRHETRHTARLVPIYPETRGLTSKGIRFLTQPILKHLDPLEDWLPPEILKRYDLPEINRAFRDIHFPSVLEKALQAKERFTFEDLFLLQLFNVSQKIQLAKEKAPAIQSDTDMLKSLIEALPFPLTFSQKKSLWEIVQDMEKPHPMNRLLQGDVGSGKTVVAALAGLSVAHRGHQTALMAPTEVLAKQHYETFKKLFGAVSGTAQPSVALLTSAGAKIFYENDVEGEISKKTLKEKIASGEIKIAIGTHALIQKNVGFQALGLVIVDEQHRFGVEQRAALLASRKGLVPHFLSMSATPIPRTLMLTVFGDLDVSLITELPAGRLPILTRIVPPEGREESYAFIRSQITEGRQVFVICPRIDPPAEEEITTRVIKELEVKSVKEEYEKLKTKIFPDLTVAMLHGQMKAKEKEEIMRAFRAGTTHILVSTSVIEVGVDVPNATIMMIEGAERFGLAQLYQFRGRVGRGEHQSHCFLFTDSKSTNTSERLRAIIEAKNGFELAERDLAIRGPGEFVGQKQSGLPDYAMQALQNVTLVKSTREAAHSLFVDDPGLKKHPLLKKRLKEFEAHIHLE